MNYIKSPLNYTGGKFKLLPQILPLFPPEVDTFIDLFSGGCNVGINVNAKRIICNDKQFQVVNIMKALQFTNIDTALNFIDNAIEKYNLTKENQEGFVALRDFYNQGNYDWYIFYTLICHAFNNKIRFNSKGEFNMPFGKRGFNPALRKKFITFVNTLQSKNIYFTSADFRQFQIEKLKQNDFIYADPPYFLSAANYNESWTEEDERDLLDLLDKIDKSGFRFALSNVLESKGKEHIVLKEWSKKYKVHYLKSDYNNCNYQRKDNGRDIEVLITNY